MDDMETHMDMEGYCMDMDVLKQVEDAHTVLLSNHIQNVYLCHFNSTWSLWLFP